MQTALAPTIPDWARSAVAKNPVTNLYFNGRAFEGTLHEAMHFPIWLEADSFDRVWACPVEVEYSVKEI